MSEDRSWLNKTPETRSAGRALDRPRTLILRPRSTVPDDLLTQPPSLPVLLSLLPPPPAAFEPCISAIVDSGPVRSDIPEHRAYFRSAAVLGSANSCAADGRGGEGASEAWTAEEASCPASWLPAGSPY